MTDVQRRELGRVAVLYCDPRGVYAGMSGVELWDEARDARRYAGPWPVVAHPPCGRWSHMAHVNQARWGARVGDDGGCFASALEAVTRWSGVLEHPADSIAWERFKLPRPRRRAWVQCLWQPGWVTEVTQRAYGHRARKRTWLYYLGEAPPPPVDWSNPEPEAWCTYSVNHGTTDLPRLGKREASATPPAFAELLVSLARSARAEAA